MSKTVLPHATRVGRVGLEVPDLGECVEFYRDVIGLAVHDRDGDRAALGAPDADLLVLREREELPPRPDDAAGLFHAAFRVPTRSALGDALERIESRGRIDGASDHGVSEALYLSDPAGNGVEVYWDRPRADWPRSGDRVDMVTLPLDIGDLRADAGDGEVAPGGTDVGHVHLEVTDIEAARAFYVDALGMTVRAAVGDAALFVAAGDYHHHVGLNVWQGRSAPMQGHGLAWFELVLPDGQALSTARNRLAAAGSAVEDVGDGFTVTDADAIQIHLRSE